MIEVIVERLPARPLLAIAHRGNYHGISQAFIRLFTMAEANGWLGPDTQSVGVYYDNPDVTPVDQLRSHACISRPALLTSAPAGCEFIELAGGDHAIGIHRGSYRNLQNSYRWMFGQWLPSSGRALAHAPSSELYVNDPMTTPEADLITHICVPLA